MDLKKNILEISEYYNLPATISNFENIRLKLLKDFPTYTPPSQILTATIASLVQFQNKLLVKPKKILPFYKDSIKKRRLLPIPSKIFKNQNTIYLVLNHILKTEKKCPDFSDESNTDHFFNLLRSLWTMLETHIDQKTLKPTLTLPNIAFSEEIEEFILNNPALNIRKNGPGRVSKKMKMEEAERRKYEIKEVAENLGATIVPLTSNEVTHILMPSKDDNTYLFSSNRPDELANVYYRTLDKASGYSCLHYWYTPDSSDIWVADNPEILKPEPSKSPKLWHLSTRWLRDSLYWNEWMNEEDYEVDMTLFKLNNKKNEKINKAPVVSNVKKGKNKKDSDEESEMLNESGSETSNSKGRKKSTRKPIKKPAIVSSSDDESNFGQGSPKSEDSDVFVEDVDSGSAFEGSAASVDSEDSVDEDIDPKIAALDEEVDEEDRFIPDDDVILRPFERRRRESDDEDDGLMEPVPEVIIRAQEAPIEVIPVIELVDLDKKIVARAKKNEFEPLSGAILKNISITNPSCGWMNHYIQNEGSLPSVHELVTAQQSKSEDASNDIKMENSNMESKSIVTQEFNGQSIHPAILSSSLNNSNLDTFTWSKEIESLKPTWFNFNLVHIYEMRVFPDFFLDDEYYAEGENIHREQRHPLKTPEFYQNVRNVIVCAYQKDLVQYMSCLACLPFVSNISQKMFNQSYELSFEDLIRLHSFFEQSGLINNAVLNLDNFREIGTFVEIKESIKTRAALLEDKTLEKRENSRGRNLKQWEVFVEDLTADSSVTKKLTEVVSLEEALNVPSKIQGVEYQCFVCSQFAYNLRYRGIYPKTLVLCPDCYKEGIFPSCMKGSEFVRVEGPVGITDPYKRPDWNDDELLALLEGIEIHDENWRKISDYVGTRTVEECIVKFLKIPIGETEKWDSLLRKRPKLEAVNFTINNELEKEENLQNNIALSDNTLTLAAEAGLEKEFKELEYNGDNNESKVTSMDIENLKKLPGLEELYEIFAASENPLTSFLSIISTCLNPAFASSSSRVVLNFITSYFAEESNLSFKGEKYDLRKLNKDLLTYAILGALRESIICCEGEEERIKKYMKLCLELQLQLVEERISCLEKINETLN